MTLLARLPALPTVAARPRGALIHGDCLEVMRSMANASVDAIVTDPPYGMSTQPDMVEVLTHWLRGDRYEHGGGGFMGKTWDSFVPGPEYWRECHRVLKPGGHLLAFAAPRTYDLMAIAIRLGGFEVRDMLSWLFGTGFPKSLNIGDGWGTALKPACEPTVLARKPLDGTVAANVLRWGTGALNIDGCRIAGPPSVGGLKGDVKGNIGFHGADGKRTIDRSMSAGRWPANVLLDEEAARALDEMSLAGGMHSAGSARDGSSAKVSANYQATSYELPPNRNMRRLGDSGGASRFFYVAKASRAERDAGCGVKSTHPTVKPIALMRWLCRLVTPPGGLVLDPFAGSGSTGCAAVLEGFKFLGIEREAEYVEIARRRINAYSRR
jgi:site-specific DNA-methyltransferase (adenine-specific)